MRVFSWAVSVSRRLGFWGFFFLFVVRRDRGLLGFCFGCVSWMAERDFLIVFLLLSLFIFVGLFLLWIFFFLEFLLGVSSGDFCVLYCLCSLINKDVKQ